MDISNVLSLQHLQEFTKRWTFTSQLNLIDGVLDSIIWKLTNSKIFLLLRIQSAICLLYLIAYGLSCVEKLGSSKMQALRLAHHLEPGLDGESP